MHQRPFGPRATRALTLASGRRQSPTLQRADGSAPPAHVGHGGYTAHPHGVLRGCRPRAAPRPVDRDGGAGDEWNTASPSSTDGGFASPPTPSGVCPATARSGSRGPHNASGPEPARLGGSQAGWSGSACLACRPPASRSPHRKPPPCTACQRRHCPARGSPRNSGKSEPRSDTARPMAPGRRRPPRSAWVLTHVSACWTTSASGPSSSNTSLRRAWPRSSGSTGGGRSPLEQSDTARSSTLELVPSSASNFASRCSAALCSERTCSRRRFSSWARSALITPPHNVVNNR